MDDDQFLEAFLNTLEVTEGTEGGDTVTGMATRPYGVKDLLGVNEEDYKDNPRGLAKAVASKNIDELKRMGIEWDKLPNSMKFNALDIQFNMGSLNKKAPKYFKAVKAGKYDTAIKESLDAIGAYDPKRKGERPTKGIALRRAKLYNMVADELGYPTITSVKAINQDNPQKSAKVTYNLSEGAAVPVTYSNYSLHSTTKPGTVSVSDVFGITAMPATGDEEGFSEPQPLPPVPTPKPKPETVKPEPAPVAPETKAQTDEVFTLDYEGELPDMGDDVPLPDLPATDVAPDTMDAITPTTVDVPEEKSIFERAYDYMFGGEDEPAEPKVDKNEIIRQNLLKELDTSGVPNMNEGGMAMERQMKMFEDGGLMDEGGTVDPVSGNDVPPGSTQEEVRDDIPAQLSEGEFVFPADVVRYIGLEKLMQMRQEAKMGLQRMEDMGQMGNSEEAVMPDDLPFTFDDLDMEDEPMEFQVGGLVPNQYGVYQQPSQFASYSQQPYQAPTIPTGQPIQQQPIQAAGFQTLPVQQVPTAPTTVPTFEQLMPTTTGQYDELREYVNEDTGQSMTIPFVDGKPIYPIPQGFTPKPTEQVEAAVPDTTVPTARVKPVSGDEDRDDGLGLGGGRIGMGGFSDGTGRKQGSTIMGVSFDMGKGFLGGAAGVGATALGLATGKGIPKDATATFTYDNATYTVSGDEYNDLKKSGYTGDLADKIVASLKTESGVRKGSIEYNKETGTFKDKKSGETFQDRDDDGDGIGDILNKSGQSIYNKYNIEDLISDKQIMNQSEKDVISAYNDAQFEAFDFGDDNNDDSGGGAPSGGGRTESAGADWSAGSDFTASEREELGPGSYNAGGLASKKKPKSKKMKQGGMASKK